MPDLRLGATVDPDDGTLQNLAAGADDVNGLFLSDEDGIVNPLLDLTLIERTTPSIGLLATNNTGTGALLVGWIDYNQDGLFDNATELATATVADGTTGKMITLTFPEVPTGASGTTYARFRLSTDAGFVATPTSTGLLPDGEVEDYIVTIVPGAGVNLVVDPILLNANFNTLNVPSGEESPGLSFNFTSSPLINGFTLQDAFGARDNTHPQKGTTIFSDGGVNDNGNAIFGDGEERVDFIQWQTTQDPVGDTRRV
ncbi:MAG: hypothetical protein GXP35_16635 [Actinobacteria bacterium]|nr:hypothetical protein [Actinomycetota bacterium]